MFGDPTSRLHHPPAPHHQHHHHQQHSTDRYGSDVIATARAGGGGRFFRGSADGRGVAAAAGWSARDEPRTGTGTGERGNTFGEENGAGAAPVQRGVFTTARELHTVRGGGGGGELRNFGLRAGQRTAVVDLWG